jgi:NAD-dependent SIR2 family protein deacetylase
MTAGTPADTGIPRDAEGGYIDGNALAGPLAELFAVDLTAATSQCAHCSNTGAVARLHVYRQAPGLVARCQQCGQVMLRLVRAPETVWLDMSGITVLSIPVGAD